MSTTQFNFFKEKLILQEEEKELKKMLEKLKDQQNRLKIEELALISTMKMEKEKAEKGLTVNKTVASRYAGSDCSMTLSSVTSKEMSNYLPVGTVEDASTINRVSLNLGVKREAFVEEEEEDSEGDEEEEKKKVAADAAAESYELMSFMENF